MSSSSPSPSSGGAGLEEFDVVVLEVCPMANGEIELRPNDVVQVSEVDAQAQRYYGTVKATDASASGEKVEGWFPAANVKQINHEREYKLKVRKPRQKSPKKEGKRWLVCLDGSEESFAAAKRCFELAAPQEEIHLLYVIDKSVKTVDEVNKRKREGGEILQSAEALFAKDQLEARSIKLHKRCKLAKVEVREEIVYQAQHLEADMVALGHKGATTVREFLGGIVPHHRHHHHHQQQHHDHHHDDDHHHMPQVFDHLVAYVIKHSPCPVLLTRKKK